METGNENRRFLECYRVTERLGDEPFEETLLAVDDHSGRPVLLRVLKGPVLRNARELAAWRRVLRTASQAKHPSIVGVLDAGSTAEGAPWFGVSASDGESLASKLRQSALPPEEAYRHAIDLASALACLHALSLAHGDLRPANVLLPADPQMPPRLLGAGTRLALERAIDSDRGWSGDVRYRARAAAGEPTDEAREDVYGFGLLVFEMLTGKAWCAGSEVTEMAPEGPDELRTFLRAKWPELPDWALNLLPRCLTPRPGRRLANGQALERELGLLGLVPVDPEPGLALPGDTDTALVPYAGAPPAAVKPASSRLPVPSGAPGLPAVALPRDVDLALVMRGTSIAILASPPALLYSCFAAHSWAATLLIFAVIDGLAVASGIALIAFLGHAVDVFHGIGVRAHTVWTQIDNKTEEILQVHMDRPGALFPDVVSLRPGTREIVSVEPGTEVSVLREEGQEPLWKALIQTPKEVEIHPDHASERDGLET